MRYLAPSFAALLLTLAGCETVEYQYRAPATEQGRMCVTQCAGIKEMCHGNEMQRAEAERATCERNSSRNYRACMSKARSKDEMQNCEKRKDSCFVSENTYRCEVDYRACYVNCGGAITEIRK